MLPTKLNNVCIILSPAGLKNLRRVQIKQSQVQLMLLTKNIHSEWDPPKNTILVWLPIRCYISVRSQRSTVNIRTLRALRTIQGGCCFLAEINRKLKKMYLQDCQDLCHRSQTNLPKFTQIKNLSSFNNKITKRATTSKTVIWVCSRMDIKHIVV